MKKCSVCFQEFINGDKLVANSMETFIFKPANIEDTVNPANVSAEELAESRKAYTRTEKAITYIVYQEGQELPSNLFNIRHVICSVMRTGETTIRNHPLVKHAVRYSRSSVRR